MVLGNDYSFLTVPTPLPQAVLHTEKCFKSVKQIVTSLLKTDL